MGKRKHNIPMCAALVLLFLTMVSIHLTSGLYARYSVTASGSDSARVARFHVVGAAENDQIEVDVATTQSGEYVFSVTNQSEVAVRYDITIEFTDEFPSEWVSVVLDNGEPADIPDTAVTFADVGTLNPNGDQRTHLLVFTVDPNAWLSQAQGADAALQLDFIVKIHAEQID